MFVCSWLFGRVPGLVACGPTGALGPVIAFELVHSPADVAALFGSEPCRSTLAAAQRSALWLDGLGFIPAYSAFLIFAVAALIRHGQWKWALIALVAGAGLLDEVEGHILGRILDALPGSQAPIDILFWIVRIKFALLALATAGIGVALAGFRRWWTVAVGIWLVIWASRALHGLYPTPDATMMTAFAVGWISLLPVALLGAWRPSLFAQAHAVPPRVQARPSA